MPEQIILAQDTLYVSEQYNFCNYYNTDMIKVGFNEYITANCGVRANLACSYENIGLVQFAPFQLPKNTRLVKVVLHLFVMRTKYRTNCIWVSPIMQPFDAKKVTWNTMPLIEQEPKLPILINPDDKCDYVTCDITRILSAGDAGNIPGFGLALSASRETMDFSLISANPIAYPVYATVEYDTIGTPIDPAHPRVFKNVFQEYVFDIEGTDEYIYSPKILTKTAQTITWFVKNKGGNILNFKLQISPDGLNFIDDKQKVILQAGEMQAITPYMFAKFMRVCISPQVQGEFVQAQVLCQMQTHNYMVDD